MTRRLIQVLNLPITQHLLQISIVRATGSIEKLIFWLTTRNVGTNEAVKMQQYFVYCKAFTVNSWVSRAVGRRKLVLRGDRNTKEVIE